MLNVWIEMEKIRIKSGYKCSDAYLKMHTFMIIPHTISFKTCVKWNSCTLKQP